MTGVTFDPHRLGLRSVVEATPVVWTGLSRQEGAGMQALLVVSPGARLR